MGTLVSQITNAFFSSVLCWGKATVAYTKPQQRKKEGSERLRGERDQIKFIDLGFKDSKLQDSGKQDECYIILKHDCFDCLEFLMKHLL